MSDPKPSRRQHKTHGPPLSVREIRFAQHIVIDDLSKADAYLRAGFPAKPTRHATESAAFRLSRKRVIREYVRTLQTAAADAAKVTVAEVAAAIANIARADRRGLFDAKGNFLPPDRWPDDVAATVEAVESDEVFEPVPGEKGKRRVKGYVRKVKTASRLAAWAKLAEYLRMVGTQKADDAGKGHDPLVVGGEANPANL